jgi:hypothetical protein
MAVAKKKRTKLVLPKIGRKIARSQFEFNIYKLLTGRLPKGADLGYETEKLSYTLHKDYVPDFVITKKDGSKIYVEAKGLGRAFDYDARSKMVAVRKDHPDLDIRIVFMSDRPFSKGGKMRPSDWALKNGFPCSVNEIPDDWLE